MSRRKRRQPREVWSFIVDGDTEKWYLDLMKQYERHRLPKVHIKPEIPKKKLRDLRDQVLENSDSYNRVFWIVDLDAIIHDEQLGEFSNIVRELREIDNVSVLVNGPCLEFWFLLHFRETARIYPKCCRVEKQLRKIPALYDYQKTEKYYKSGTDIYAKLKEHQETAVKNAEKLGEFSLIEGRQAVAEIGRVFDLFES